MNQQLTQVNPQPTPVGQQLTQGNQQLTRRFRPRPYRGLLLSALALLVQLGLAATGCDGHRTPGAPAVKAGQEAVAAQPAAAVAAQPAAKDVHCSDPGSCGAGPSDPGLLKVPLGDSQARGGAQAKVTVVEFCDFQCPFCKRATSTLKELRNEYGDELRVVFKHLPLPFHDRARAAALAVEAAAEQGKFWEMHDALFENPASLSDAELLRHAQALGLDVERWRRDARGERAARRVDDDTRLAEQLAVHGTPSFLINGRLLAGAQPLAAFKTIADEELAKATGLLRAGVPRTQLYEELTKGGAEKVAPPPAPAATAAEVMKVELGDAPVQGPADALVTIVVFSDFECPFCARVDARLATVAEQYKGRVRLVWKDRPLPFHNHAMLAAVAAREAKAQGKFWELKRTLLANQSALDRAALERYATELGLEPGRFKAALDGQVWKSAIEADIAQAVQLGVRGTPVSFINGVRITGAQTLEVFKARIDEELRKAEKLVGQGVAADKVYETLIRAGRASAAGEP